jgi:PAS domain S-box-containing protein
MEEPREAVVEQPSAEAVAEAVFAQVDVGLCLVDPAGRVLRASRRWLESVGLPEDAVLGQALWELFPATPPDLRELHERARGGEVVDVPEHVQPLHGRDVWYRGRLVPVGFPAGTGVLISAWDVTPAKRIELQLRSEHEILRRHVVSTPLALVEWNGQHRVTACSARAEELFGFAAAEVVGRRIDELPWVAPEDARTQESLSPAQPTSVRVQTNVRRDGTVVQCEWYTSAIHDSAGRLVSALALVLDVTERSRLERELRRSAELIRLAHDAFLTWTETGGIQSWNTGAEETYGYSAEEALGRSSHELLQTRFPRPWPEIRRDIIERGRWRGELGHRRKDGTLLRVSAHMQLIREADGRELVLEVTHDVTDLELARQRAEWLARLPLENPDPVMRVSGAGVVLFANEAARRLLQAVEGATAPAVLGPELRQAIEGRQRAQTDLQVGDRNFSVSLIARDEDVNVYAQDTSARRLVEAELRAANERLLESDRRKDEFLAMLSHELRNPLAAIATSLGLLERVDPAGASARRARDVVQRQMRHLTHLVDDLLDVTRIARGKITLHRERLDLGELVRRAVEDARPGAEDRGVRLELAAAPGVWADADPTRIAQVTSNLLHNAAKFTPRGGEIRVSVAHEGGAAVVRVRDTGVGIEPAQLAGMFEAFVQAESSLARTEGGLGLGLALVKGIVELHGGRVEARSNGPGLGAEFAYSLPVVEASSAAEAGHPAPGRVTGRRVLVVDDNRDAADSLAEFLTLAGHTCTVVYDGSAAIDRGLQEPFDAILCDLGLPLQDGYEVARQLRTRGVPAKLVAVSGYSRPDDVERARAAGFDAHVPKPPDLGTLLRLLS